MIKIREYIENIKKEINSQFQQNRVRNIIKTKNYIEEKRAILNKGNIEWNGETISREKILLNYIDTLMNFESSFLLKNPITLVSDDVDCLEQYKGVYKRGKYNILDYEILEQIVKYGECFEYVYLDGDKIKSKILDNLECYPMYNRMGEYVRLIQTYSFDYENYYIVYEKDIVTEYHETGDKIEVIGQYENLSGLPIRYYIKGEDTINSVSSLSRYANIIDSMEDILSRQADTFNKFNNPIPVLKGGRLNPDETLDTSLAGAGLQLQPDSDFDFVNPDVSAEMFSGIWNTLKSALVEVSQTPSILLSSSNLSNVSEETIKIMFSLAEVKAKKNEIALRKGFEKRFKYIKRISNEVLNKELDIDSYVDVKFNYNIPQSNSTKVDDIVKLYDSNIVSRETVVENNPYVDDVSLEMARLNKKDDEDISDCVETKNDDVQDVQGGEE